MSVKGIYLKQLLTGVIAAVLLLAVGGIILFSYTDEMNLTFFLGVAFMLVGAFCLIGVLSLTGNSVEIKADEVVIRRFVLKKLKRQRVEIPRDVITKLEREKMAVWETLVINTSEGLYSIRIKDVNKLINYYQQGENDAEHG